MTCFFTVAHATLSSPKISYLKHFASKLLVQYSIEPGHPPKNWGILQKHGFQCWIIKSTICILLFLISIYHCVKSVKIWSFFWSVISRIQTEYGEILRISPYPIWMREYRDQEKRLIWTLFTQCILFKMSTNFPLKLKISTRIVTVCPKWWLTVKFFIKTFWC